MKKFSMSILLLATLMAFGSAWGAIPSEPNKIRVHLYTVSHQEQFYQGMPVLLKVSLAHAEAKRYYNAVGMAKANKQQPPEPPEPIQIASGDRPWPESISFIVYRLTTTGAGSKEAKVTKKAVEIFSGIKWPDMIVAGGASDRATKQLLATRVRGVRVTWGIPPEVTKNMEPGVYEIVATFAKQSFEDAEGGVEKLRSETLKIIVKSYPSDPAEVSKIHEKVARYHLLARRYARVIEVVKNGLEANAEYNAFHLLLGQAYEKNGQLQEAIAEYEAYIRNLPPAKDSERPYGIRILGAHIENLKKDMQ